MVQGVSASPYAAFDNWTRTVDFSGLEAIAGAAEKAKAEQAAKAKRDAYVFNESGQLDRNATLQAMAGIDPAEASKMQADWAKQDAQASKMQTESMLKENELIGRTMLAVKDQEGYDRARQMLGPLADKYGLPPVYDASYTRQIGLSSLGPMQQMELAKANANRPAPPTGYRYTADFRGLEPIPGGPVEKKDIAAKEKEAFREQTKARAAKTVVQDVGRALELLQDESNWIGPVASRVGGLIPGSSANVIQDHIDSIKSNISVDQLQSMRESSPTGGALGNVTEKQQEKLESLLGSLKNTQDREVLEDNLKRIQNEYNMIVHGEQGIKDGVWTPYELSFDEQGRKIAKKEKGKKTLTTKLKNKFKQNTAEAAPATTPAGRPLKVMQNGFEYTWNPKTGRYE